MKGAPPRGTHAAPSVLALSLQLLQPGGHTQAVTTEPTTQDESDANDLGTAAKLLLEDGKIKSAALLLDARIVERNYVDTGFPMDSDTGIDLFNVVIEAPRFLVERFDDEVVSEVTEALNEALQADHVHVMRLEVRAVVTPASANWREELEARLSPRATNQASVGPRMRHPLMDDGCAFRSKEEMAVYRAFKRQRDRLPDDDTIGLMPNPAFVLRNVHTQEPDLLVTYRGRVGLVQVDGPSHRGRFAAEVTRDRLYRHSGIAEIDHFVVEDTDNDQDLEVLVARFLRRLGGSATR